MDACAIPPQSDGFIGSMTHFVDCQAELLGSGAYQALGAPGSTLAVVLTGFLTIFIALIGYNLLLGRGPTLRTGVLAMVKIGAVLALATSWPAYKTLVYDLVTQGPAEIVGDLGRPTSIPGSDGSLVGRLDLADGALVQLAVLGAGDPVIASQDYRVPPPPFGGFNAFALGGSRILFLLTAIAGLVTIRVIAALMLALGPFFIAFMLFDGTRSLFEGWVRVLAGAAIGAVGAALALGVEVALVEPWLAGILVRRAAGEALPSVPTELVVVTLFFAITIIAVIVASAHLARAFRLAPILRLSGIEEVPRRVAEIGQTSRFGAINSSEQEERSRATTIAHAAVAMYRREGSGAQLEGMSRAMMLAGQANVPMAQAGARTPGPTHIPVGRSFTRRSRGRVSARADRRDMAQ